MTLNDICIRRYSTVETKLKIYINRVGKETIEMANRIRIIIIIIRKRGEMKKKLPLILFSKVNPTINDS